MFLVPQTNLGLGKCAPTTPRNISTRECVAVCVCATSPLLYGPFLISPRRDQSATPRISTPKPPRPDIKSRDTDRSALAPELPQAPLRGEVPTRVTLISERHSQPVYPQVGFVIFLLIEYPYTTLSSPAGRRLSTHAHRVWDLHLSGYCDKTRAPHGSPHQGLLCLSLISVWSDSRRHRLPSTRLVTAVACRHPVLNSFGYTPSYRLRFLALPTRPVPSSPP